MFKKKKLLLHACCAPCASYVIQVLKKDYDLSLFFYNPNIHPEREYIIRRDELKKYAKKLKINFIEGDYNYKEWFKLTDKYKTEKEGGRRCELCFADRFEKAVIYAKKHNYDIWTSTLSISPHKNAEILNRIGNILEEKYSISYLESNWKKKNGYKISCEISKKENFYRQEYCGCIYSYKERLLYLKTKNLE